MKKYITIAALLAAGTAIANADYEAFIVGTDASSNPNWAVTLDDNAWGNLGTVSFIPNVGEMVEGQIADAWKNSKALEDINDATEFSITSADLDNLKYTYDEGYASKSKMTIEFSEIVATGKEVTLYVFQARAGSGGSNTLGCSVLSGISNVSVMYAYADGDGFETNRGGNTTPSNELLIAKVTGTLDSSTVSFTTTGGAGKNGWAGVIANISTIPEPSAFGLLAGIGALALVASRRRRK